MNPRITADGSFVYFMSDAPFFESERGPRYEAYRVAVATGVVERVGALESGSTLTGYLYYWGVLPHVEPDEDGNRAVLNGHGDFTGQNPDRFPEIWLIDRDEISMIEVSGPAPTTISWQPESGPLRYDVIRGDVANLQPGAGSTVDLGTVTCLENNSPDAVSADTDDPAPGQTLFYVFRGSQGLLAGPGSYGQGTGAAERTPSLGDCPS